jgi:hypothetical protein
MSTENTLLSEKPFRVIIAGSRSFEDYELLREKCDKILEKILDRFGEIIIVSGTARGADRLGERYANDRGYAIERYPAQWDTYGKSAGYKRNAQMAENADALIAFPVGVTKGTQHMIKIATDARLHTRVIQSQGNI